MMACMVAKYSSRLSSLSDSKIRAALSRHRQLPLPPPPQPKKPPPPQLLGPGGAGSVENKRKSSCSSGDMKGKAPSLQTARNLGVPEPWWEGELAEAIHRTLRLRESMLNTLKLSSSQLHKRAGLIGFISEVCQRLPVMATTRHLAVLLLDHFMDSHAIKDYRLQLVALTCLLIASKLEDRDDHIPSVNQLRCLAGLDNTEEHSNATFLKMELYIMKFFAWSVSYPTAAHFIGYYNSQCYQNDCYDNILLFPTDLAFSETDFLDDISMPDLDLSDDDGELDGELESSLGDMELSAVGMECEKNSLRNQLEEITSLLLEKALHDYRFLEYPPSMVAAAAVCVGRMQANVCPAWTSRLESVSYYTRQALEPIIELLLSL